MNKRGCIGTVISTVAAWVSLGFCGSLDSAFAQCPAPLPPPPPPGGGALLYSLNGQTIEAEKNGSFVISNIAVPDVQAPFNVGDDYLRIVGVLPTNQGTQYGCPMDDWTLYLFTETAFQMTPGGQYVLEPGDVDIRCNPPPLPESIMLTTVGSPVLVTGQTRQLQTTAKLTSGGTQDLTLPTLWTTYRTSNGNIARTVQSMCGGQPCVQVQAISPGTAFITATNGGATSVEQITVVRPGAIINTTVEGFVQRADGSAVVGGMVSVQVYGGAATPSGAAGFFSIPLVLPDNVTDIVVEAAVETESQTELGVSPTLTPIPDGITDAGIIVIDLFCDTPWSTAFGPTLMEGGAVQAFAVFDNDGAGAEAPRLIAGGKFNKAGGVDAGLVAQWDGSAWQPVGGSFTPGPNGLLFDGDDGLKALAALDLNDGNGPMLYAGGSFIEAENVTSTIALARWNGVSWSDIGGGVGDSHDTANALVAFNNELYVGGDFLTAGPYDGQNMQCLPGCVNAKRIAKWNPNTQTWSPVGPGFNDGEVRALAVFQSALYAGGTFTSLVGGQSVSGIAKWNGNAWTQVGSGLSNVNALLVFDDGSGSALYAGGNFSGGTGNYVSKWNGISWVPVGPGLSGGQVLALAGLIDGANRYLYACGQFSGIGGGGGSANYIARWNGTSWSALNTGLEVFGTALAAFDHGEGPIIHVSGEVCTGNCPTFEAGTGGRGGRTGGGRDKSARFAPAYSGFVATWEPGEWSVLSNGLSDEVHAMTVHDDGSGPALIAGGKFKPPRGPRPDNPSPLPTNGIAKFDGIEWSSLGTGMTKSGSNPPPADVRALVTFDEDGTGSNPQRLFAGGDFNFAGGVSGNNVARWDGSVWSAVGNIGGIVNGLAVFDEDGAGANPPRLFAGGDFTNRISRWNGSSWTVVGTGINNGTLNALTAFNNQLYVGGTFLDAGGVAAADYLARWNGSNWSGVQSGGSGVNAAVYALHVFDRDGNGPMPPALYVGGAFTTAGGITVNRIARWDGTTWSRVGPASDSGLGPVGSKVLSLFGFDNGQGPMLYTGGNFTQSGNGSLTLKRIAKWNPVQDQWLAAGSNQFGNGLDGGNSVSVSALAAFDDGVTGQSVYAGGSFDSAGGQFDQDTDVCVDGTGCVPAANIAKLGCR